jgi:hypothetical protein
MIRCTSSRSATTPFRSSSIRSLAVYAVGEGWTGALGTGRLDERIPGHFDDEEELEIMPALTSPMYTGKVHSVAIGWGHTAVLTAQHELMVTGRPHDFSALLRLKRLPEWIRNYSVRQTLETTNKDSFASEEKDANSSMFNPTELVGNFVSWFSDALSPESKEWEAARQQSINSQLTPLALDHHSDGEYPVALACSAGFSAYLTNQGYLYTFGLNGYGQCGIGVASNNVWQPRRVTGLCSDFANAPRAQMEQSYPITQVALGLQHGICLNSEGEVFCWGKGERGQLGQERVVMESHTALPVKRAFSFDEAWEDATVEGETRNLKPVYEPIGKVRQIAAGMIHTAALTEDNRVLVWGKYVHILWLFLCTSSGVLSFLLFLFRSVFFH